jgi:hypothetical protein
MVDSFTNADLKYSEAPFEESDYFDQDRSTIFKRLGEVACPQNASEQLKEIFLDLLSTPRCYGTLSSCHTAFSYVDGLSHPSTVRTAHLFAIALDAPKQGKRMKEPKLQEILSASVLFKICSD